MITEGIFNGHRALWLENERVRVGILPHKGADIFEFQYTRPGTGPVQFLMKTPWGLKPPQTRPQADFLENYEGGWQELFPNANDACQYGGLEIPFHGEAALAKWEYHVLPSPPEESILELCTDCRKLPFRLERRMYLEDSENRLFIQEQVTNIGNEPSHFVWGHHLTLGGDFLEEGCRLEIPAHQIYTPEILYEPETAHLQPGQATEWPQARARGGDTVDLRQIPGPGAHTHDDVIVGGLEHGCYRLTNPRLHLAFDLEWDVDIFPWLMLWQPYGGADMPPLTGIYGVGLEPWVSRYPLARAVEEGQARLLGPGESLQTELVAGVEEL